MQFEMVRHNWPENAGFTIARTLPANKYVLVHFHNAVRLTIGDARMNVRPGGLVVFGPGVFNEFTSDEPLLHDWMHIGGDVEAEMRRFGLEVNTLYQPGCSAQITDLAAQLESEIFAQRSHWQFLADMKLRELFVLVARDLNSEAALPVSRETAERLRSLRAEMLMHPEEDWSNEVLARFVNLSVSRLYPLYRRMFSISPNRDLILMRVERAKNLLSTGESVTRVAERMGYASSYHFIRQFRQVTGVTPGQFAKGGKEEK